MCWSGGTSKCVILPSGRYQHPSSSQQAGWQETIWVLCSWWSSLVSLVSTFLQMSAEHTLPFQGALSPHWGQRGCAALLPRCLQPTSSSAGHSGEVRLDLLSVVYMMRGRYLNVPVVVVSALWLPVCCCCPEKVCDAGRLKPARLPPPLISRHQQHNQERRDSVQLVVQTCRHQTQSKQQTHTQISSWSWLQSNKSSRKSALQHLSLKVKLTSRQIPVDFLKLFSRISRVTKGGRRIWRYAKLGPKFVWDWL